MVSKTKREEINLKTEQEIKEEIKALESNYEIVFKQSMSFDITESERSRKLCWKIKIEIDLLKWVLDGE